MTTAIVKQEATPEALLSQAIEAKLDPAAMAEFYGLYRQMKADQARASFADALSAFKADCPPIPRRTPNNQFKKVDRNGVSGPSMFASLKDIDATIRGPLGKHGLSTRWTGAEIKDGILSLTCEVTHRDGHHESSRVQFPLESKAGCSEQQRYGIVMTYAQRYSLIQALGLTTCDEDTDGNLPGEPAASGPITAEQAANLELAVENVKGDKARFLKRFGADTFAAFPRAKYGDALVAIQEKREKGK